MTYIQTFVFAKDKPYCLINDIGKEGFDFQMIVKDKYSRIQIWIGNGDFKDQFDEMAEKFFGKENILHIIKLKNDGRT